VNINLAIELELNSIDFDGAFRVNNDESYLLFRGLIVMAIIMVPLIVSPGK
jgi:hypothetical protein